MSSVASIAESAITSAASSITKQALGKEDFLKLLVAQLNNQDPLNPADATEFTAQLAQFSSLEQLFNVNDTLAGLSSMSTDMEKMSALNLIGKEVVVSSDNFDLGSDPVLLGYKLDATAEEARVHILNASGQTVATLEAPELTAGEHLMVWDGRNGNGDALPAGNYTLAVVALNQDDEFIDTSTVVRSQVTGVDMTGGSTNIVTGNGSFPMADVASVLGE